MGTKWIKTWIGRNYFKITINIDSKYPIWFKITIDVMM